MILSRLQISHTYRLPYHLLPTSLQFYYSLSFASVFIISRTILHFLILLNLFLPSHFSLYKYCLSLLSPATAHYLYSVNFIIYFLFRGFVISGFTFVSTKIFISSSRPITSLVRAASFTLDSHYAESSSSSSVYASLPPPASANCPRRVLARSAAFTSRRC